MLSIFISKKNRWWAAIGALILIGIGGIVFSRNGNGSYETFVVERRSIVEDVRVAGSVEANTVSNIGFEASGTVRDVSVSVNDIVYRGQRLASLSLGTLAAELQSAQAQVAIRRAQMSNTGLSLDAVREKQDTLVANAYSELLSNDLIAEPQSASYTVSAPVIGGRYIGSEGTYKINVRVSPNGEADLMVFGLDSFGPIRVNKTTATPLGTTGLHIRFPDVIASYHNTIWYVTIPNTKSASYTTYYNAYQNALSERERALDDAEAQLRTQESGSSIAAAELAQAQAEVARIEALIGQRILTAPFDGVITAVDISPGESVSASNPALSIISNDGFGIEIDVPEIDSIKVRTGNPVAITLEAIPNEVFVGSVVSINRTETRVDGVSVYQARIAFEGEEDERIASGMTAEVAITTQERTNVLAIPARAIAYREDGTPFVSVKQSETDKLLVERDIALGLRGSDGFVEVVAGLEEGHIIAIVR